MLQIRLRPRSSGPFRGGGQRSVGVHRYGVDVGDRRQVQDERSREVTLHHPFLLRSPVAAQWCRKAGGVLMSEIKYFDELSAMMNKIASIPNSVFIGQAVACPGTAMSRTLENVPADKKIELPVFEDTQMGMAIGLSLRGLLPVCVFPRWNFLLLAMNQLVLHLDKLPIYSRGS